MSFPKKKVFGIVALAIVCAIGIIVFNKTAQQRIPSDGIYVCKHLSYYAYGPDEEKRVYLDCFVVDNHSQEESSTADRYSDFYVTDSDGRNYNITYTSADVSNMLGEMSEVPVKGVTHLEINFLIFTNEHITLTGFHYKDENNTDVYREIGSVEIETLPASGKELAVISNRVFWESIIFPPFESFEFDFENKTESSMTVSQVSFGNTGIQAEPENEIKLDGKQKEESVIPATLPKENETEPVVYYMKPKVMYSIDGVQYQTNLLNVSRERYYNFTTAELQEYLYGIDQQGKD